MTVVSSDSHSLVLLGASNSKEVVMTTLAVKPPPAGVPTLCLLCFLVLRCCKARVDLRAGYICATALRLQTKHRAQRGEAAVMLHSTLKALSLRKRLLEMEGRNRTGAGNLNRHACFMSQVQRNLVTPENLRFMSAPKRIIASRRRYHPETNSVCTGSC